MLHRRSQAVENEQLCMVCYVCASQTIGILHLADWVKSKLAWPVRTQSEPCLEALPRAAAKHSDLRCKCHRAGWNARKTEYYYDSQE